MSHAIDLRQPRNYILLAVFLLVVLGVGALIGTQTQPGTWYESLEKPFFNPPNWIFGPVWTALYILIAIAGWRTFIRAPRSPQMGVWVLQMVFNWAWSPVWFGLKLQWPAFAVIAVIFALIITFIVMTWNRDRPSALMFVPYAAWVGFASILNFSIAVMN